MKNTLRVAVLDMYKGISNQGMPSIRNILTEYGLQWDEFDVRSKMEVPDTSYDLYISTGGPGTPYEVEGGWDKPYTALLDTLLAMNKSGLHPPKYMFFICHSYQVMCIHWQLGNVCQRRSTAFGVMSVHKTAAATHDSLFDGLPEPIHAVDSRDWQMIEPNKARLKEMGAKIMLIEKYRPHVDLPRAIMGIRISPQMMGVQFHPEADPEGMKIHFTRPDMVEKIIRDHGEAKYHRLMTQLHHPERILIHAKPIFTNFIEAAIAAHTPVMA